MKPAAAREPMRETTATMMEITVRLKICKLAFV